MMLDIDKGWKVTKPDFGKKIGSSTKYENVVKITVFRLFLENGSTNDFDQTRSEGRTNQFRAPPENRMSKKSPFSR